MIVNEAVSRLLHCKLCPSLQPAARSLNSQLALALHLIREQGGCTETNNSSDARDKDGL